MARRSLALVCALVAGAGAPLAAGVTTATANPIRKVVNMLQDMQKKVVAESEKSEELFKKFGCYCKTGGQELSASIAAAESKVAELGPAIEASTSKKSQLEKDLVAHKADREAANKAMEEATALREKERAAYDKTFADSSANVGALEKAIAALEKGMSGSFLQSTAAASLRSMASESAALSDDDRQTLLAFLAGSQSEGYAPASGEISGILKQMKDEMAKDLSDTVADEKAAVESYEGLMSAKKKEVASLTKALEEKLTRVGELGVQIASMENDLEDTSQTLAEDKAFLADLKTNCESRGAIHEEEKKSRAAELVALSETIKVLNDDDALDLFKKTLPSAAMSFVQVQRTSAAVRADAREAIDQVRARLQPHQRTDLDFISLALRGRKVGFEAILKHIDELVATLKEEQKSDDEKKDYCTKEFDVAEDKQKALERSLADIDVSIAEVKEGIQTLTEEVKATKEGIVALDKSVAEATEQRKKENEEFKQLMADNGAAKELILFAKNRLAKFYAPALHKPEALVQLSEDSDAAPPPPPEVAAAYTAKSQESTGVMAMMDLLVADLDKEMTIAKTEEENAQKEYEQTMADSGSKRALDSKSLTDKEASKAGMEASLEAAGSDKKATTKEIEGAKEYLMTLHGTCDWLIQFYDTRKTARADEVDSLQKAQAVLSGADYSFLQTVAQSARARKFLRTPKM